MSKSKSKSKSRRIDGKPETAADRRFFSLRESGFTGPVDQDGRALMSRTDARGNPLPMFRGGTGTGTPDDKRARR